MSAATDIFPESARRPRRVVLVAGLALLLIAAIAFQGLYQFRELPRLSPRVRLSEVVPRALDGWTVTDEPLGQTEAVNAAALRTLNLDDYVYRQFRRGGSSFTVYAAYWAPGRMPTRLVASHTPDRCWTENGMRCVEMGFREAFSLDGKKLKPAEYRAFTAATGGEKTFVVYWHVVEGKIYDYGARFNAIPSPWLWWKDTLAQATYGSREQIFVRVASSTPIRELWNNADFQAMMSTLGGAGLFEAAQ